MSNAWKELSALTEQQAKAVVKAVTSDSVKMIIGSENWDLTEDEELQLWAAIKSLERAE
jgi:hypothetical protein